MYLVQGLGTTENHTSEQGKITARSGQFPQINFKKRNLLLAITQSIISHYAKRMRYITDYFRNFVLKKVLRYDP